MDLPGREGAEEGARWPFTGKKRRIAPFDVVATSRPRRRRGGGDDEEEGRREIRPWRGGRACSRTTPAVEAGREGLLFAASTILSLPTPVSQSRPFLPSSLSPRASRHRKLLDCLAVALLLAAGLPHHRIPAALHDGLCAINGLHDTAWQGIRSLHRAINALCRHVVAIEKDNALADARLDPASLLLDDWSPLEFRLNAFNGFREILYALSNAGSFLLISGTVSCLPDLATRAPAGFHVQGGRVCGLQGGRPDELGAPGLDLAHDLRARLLRRRDDARRRVSLRPRPLRLHLPPSPCQSDCIIVGGTLTTLSMCKHYWIFHMCPPSLVGAQARDKASSAKATPVSKSVQ
ncbi:hypothetical protein EJB05_00213, partial [Eragrostis curvula]